LKFLLSILTLSLIACTLIAPPKPESSPLRVVYDLWPGFLPILIAQEKGFFTHQGVKVEAVFTKNAAEKIPEFGAGNYDGITLALGNVLTSSATNPDITIILATDISAGADAAIVQPQILSVRDLKGKTVGTHLGGFGELFVSTMLAINGMTTDDITLTNAQGEQILPLIQSGKIQAGQTWEPYISQGVKAGLRVLFTSEQTPGLIPDVIVFQGSVLRNRSSEVRAFVRAWFQAVDYWKANPKQGNALIAKALDLKPEAISLEGVKLLTLSDNRQAFTPGTTTQSLHYTTQLYSNFFARTGNLNSIPDLKQLLNSSFLQ
jgi:NitT/TauT family transport system substrate-binding protein